MIRVEVGGDTLAGLGDEVLAELRPRAEAAVADAAMHLHGTVRETLSRRGTGRVYRRGKRGRTHQASAPGEPPAVDTGRLRNSIAMKGPTWEGDAVTGEVGTNVEYAARLEFGGTDSRGVRIAARPYMRPALEQAAPAIERRLGAL